jgi:hypothetical protein
MRYMLLIYTNENARQTPEQAQQVMEGHGRAMKDAARKGFLRGAEPLVATSSATTLRLQGGKTVITDGPFAETKEQLAGYYLLECENLDDAMDIARQIPTACGGGGGCVEIRPIRVFPARPESTEASGATHA